MKRKDKAKRRAKRAKQQRAPVRPAPTPEAALEQLPVKAERQIRVGLSLGGQSNMSWSVCPGASVGLDADGLEEYKPGMTHEEVARVMRAAKPIGIIKILHPDQPDYPPFDLILTPDGIKQLRALLKDLGTTLQDLHSDLQKASSDDLGLVAKPKYADLTATVPPSNTVH